LIRKKALGKEEGEARQKGRRGRGGI